MTEQTTLTKTYKVPGTDGKIFTILAEAVEAATHNYGYVDVYEGDDLVDMLDLRTARHMVVA